MRASWRHVGASWPPPFDPGLVWANPDFDYEAERVWREMHPRASESERYNPGPIPAADVVRPYWRKIRRNDLSEAEHELAEHENGQMIKTLRDIVVKRMPSDRSDKWRSRPATIDPPPLPALDDPRTQEWLDRMGT
jgi:hypothetical protein